MKAFVTGAGGFAGRHLAAHLLEEGDDVVLTGRGSDLTNLADRFPGATVAELDIRDAEAARSALSRSRPDVVYHLAAMAFVPDVERDRPAAFDVNVGGTLRVLEAARALSPAPRVVVVSTGHLYAPSREPISESGALDTGSFYALTKRQAEGIAEHFASRELHCVIARPFNHAGPGQSPLFVLPSFARQVAEAEAGLRAPSLAVGNLDAVRDFSDVRDVVRAYRLLALKGERGGLYNIASGQGRSIRSALDGLLAKARIPIAVNVDTARLRSHDAAAIVGDAAKLRARTGWTPQIPFEKTLDDLLEDARAEAARVKAAPHPA